MADSNTTKIQQESRWLKTGMTLFLVTLLSGLINLLPFDSFPNWYQINLIIHTFSASLLSLPVCVYTYLHFKRTLGIRRPLLIFSGLILALILIGLFGSGFIIAFQGQMERFAFIPALHTVSSYTLLFCLVLHILVHIINHRSKPRKTQTFITLPNTLKRDSLITIALYGLSITGLSFAYSVFYDAPKAPDKPDYEYVYGDHPFRPSQTETQSGTFVPVEQIAKSEQCGQCHQDIYQQWLSSTHRQAASDPAYVKNINLLEKKRGIAATRYCEGCHAPVALLTGELSQGGKHGGIPDTPAHLEGVGCLGCHGINKIVHLNGTASYEFSPKERYLFESSDKRLAQHLRNFLIRLKPKTHKETLGSNLIKDPKLCATCHEQFMDESMNNWGWVKMQSEYTNWLKSPFSGQTDQHRQHETQLNCQSCHFPLVAGSDPSANAQEQIRSHRSLGANTILPILNGDKEQFEQTKRFLQSAKLLLAIQKPQRKDNLQSHQFIDETLRPVDEDNTPYFLYLGEEAEIDITVTNRLVGHTFPAGTTDINQAWLYVKVTDADERTVYESGALNEQGELDKKAHTYHSIPVDRQGKAIWKHDLFRMIGDSYQNLIPSGKSDSKRYRFRVPAWAQEPLTVTAILKYRKFNQRYARWVLEQENPQLPIIDMARDSLTIPLKIKPITQDRQ